MNLSDREVFLIQKHLPGHDCQQQTRSSWLRITKLRIRNTKCLSQAVFKAQCKAVISKWEDVRDVGV
jgi:hypothetical protein